MPAATAHATIKHDASGPRTARAHVAHLLVRSGGSYVTCFALCVCEGNDTDCDLGCFWCSFADSECAFCAGCQLRLHMLRSGIMHRGCGRPVRTSRTFSYDRAAPSAPVVYFVCAKEMTPIIWGLLSVLLADSECAFCAGSQLRLHMLRSGIMHRGCGRPVHARCARFVTIGRLLSHLLCTLCVRRK